MRACRFLIVTCLAAGLVAAPNVLNRLKPPPDELASRREAVVEMMGGSGILILFSAPQRRRSGAIAEEFRQENNLYYLTGVDQQGAILLLMPENETDRTVLFLPEVDPYSELWTGEMLSAEQARAQSGIAQVLRLSEFDSFLNSMLAGAPFVRESGDQIPVSSIFPEQLKDGTATLFLPLSPNRGKSPADSGGATLSEELPQRFPNLRVRDAAPILAEVRLIKSPFEIELIRKAASITADALLQAMTEVSPGRYEYEIEALIEYVFRRSGARGPGFPSVVGSGPNSTTLHYWRAGRMMEEGDIIVMDVGAEYGYYSADVTRTIPVNDQFSPRQARIYELVHRARKAALETVKPGVTWEQVNRAAIDVLVDGLSQIGLITDTGAGQHRVFIPHYIGHWLGMDVHDVGSRRRPFEPGMVLTIEPGVYIRADSIDRLRRAGVAEADLERIAPKVHEYLNIGVRIEDSVLVTGSGNEILSSRAPVAIADIERLRAGAPASP